jgi:hypothetical protein
MIEGGLLTDLAELDRWLEPLRMRCVLSEALRRFVPDDPGLEFMARDQILAACVGDPSLVPIGLGTQFGISFLARSDVFEAGLKPGSLIAIAGFSVLSGSYGGLSVYPLVNDKSPTQPTRGPPRPLA